jgi:hypothetical protein
VDLYKGTGEEQLTFCVHCYLLFDYGRARKMGMGEPVCYIEKLEHSERNRS